MADVGSLLDRQESDEKLDRYEAAFERDAISRWAVETRTGEFLGYCGVMIHDDPTHPLGAHAEIGWRLLSTRWGKGYATESAEAAISDARGRRGLTEIMSYTAPENARSQAVMRRIGLTRRPDLDFTHTYAGQSWKLLVWTVPESWSGRSPTSDGSV